MAGLTLDTGALIALEKRSPRMAKVWTVAAHDGVEITVPTAVVAEWWRGQRGPIARLLDSVTVEPLTLSLARCAGFGPILNATDVTISGRDHAVHFREGAEGHLTNARMQGPVDYGARSAIEW